MLAILFPCKRLLKPLILLKGVAIILFFLLALTGRVGAQAFMHPGGLHTQADLDRMRTRVAAGAQPWLESWNQLILNSKAQSTYNPAPQANMGANRQRASADAVAAYLNAIRGYVANSTAHIDNAIRICNLWSAAVNQVPTGTDQPGLNGLYTYQFAVVGEILRIYVGTRWAVADFNRFKNMMTQYLYPACHDFLVNHRGTCISHYWANWDAANIVAIAAIGVLCDDRTKYNEAVTYYQSGGGNGSIMNAVYHVHPGNLGQWQETGRDEEHAALGVGLLAAFCEITRNQGLDMYGYANNRLLAGAEYTAMFNLWKPVPYAFYDNCDDVNNYWASRSQRGRLQRPIWEQLYNHYVVRQGLSAPNLTAIAALNRPEGYSHDDHFGYGTLTFTLNPSAYPPLPVPSGPTGLTASAGVGQVYLKWNAPATANGFIVRRATTSGGPYTTLATYRGIIPEYYDRSVTNGTTYYYTVAANNQAGTSGNSAQVNATPVAAGTALPTGWTRQDIGTVAAAGSATYANIRNGTFIVSGSGASLGGTADGIAFTHRSVTGDMTLTVRLIEGNASGVGGAGRIGIMIRESLATDAKAQAMVLGDAGFRWARYGSRAATGGSMSFVKGNEYTGLAQAPTWFRLQRVGNTFTAYQSDEGIVWHTVGSNTVTMASTVYAGLAIASNSGSTINMTFDNVTIVEGGGGGPIANGTYQIIARHSGKALEVADNGTANGSNVRQWPSNDCACQRWTVTNTGNNQYTIVGVGSGRNLDVADNSTADGANIHIWQSTGGNNQRFTFTATSSGYYRITPVHSGKAVDVSGNSTADGANIQQWTYNGGNNQQWQLVPVSSSASMTDTETIPAADHNAVVYPNPVTSQLTIKLNGFEKGATVTLSDDMGRILYTKPVKGTQYLLDLSTISSGVYFIKISNGTKSSMQKIVKR